MSKLLFRVDGSTQIGYGHLIRCICLANYSRKKGKECLFILRLSDQKVESLLDREKLSYLVIRTESDIVSQKEPGTKLILDINNKVLFEGASAYNDHLSFLKKAGFLTIVFEEFTQDPFPSDMIVIPYVGAEEFIQSTSFSSRYLLGPDYFIFRDEFLISPVVVIREEVKTLFICMGGTDPEKTTEKIIGFLLKYPKTFSLKIVFAAIHKKREDVLRKLLQSYNNSYEILISPSSISAIMVSSDLGIINSGLIKYETCMLGLPCISLSNSESHESVMHLFAERKLLKHMGITDKIAYEDFVFSFSSLVNDQAERIQISDHSRRMFDGKGIERVFTEIENLKN